MQMLSEKFKRHIGEPIKFKIGEDEFEFKPLPNKFTPQFMVLIKHMASARAGLSDTLSEKEMAQQLITRLDSDTWELLNSLMLEGLKHSNPDEPEDGLKEFLGSNFLRLMEPFIRANTGAEDETKYDSGESGQNKEESA